jgi:alpha-amylase
MLKLVVTVGLLLCASASHAMAGSTEEWKQRTIYQVLTDRFDNPMSSAGCGNLGQYCGGTWKGIEAKLDYITGMGFDAIWISPVVQNTDGGYHGYWAQNIYALNSHFGSDDDLRSLIKTAHAKGVWVMLDVVGNHMGDASQGFGQYVPFNQDDHYHDCNGCSNCNIADFNNQAQVEHCRLAGLADLNQDNEYVANTLRSWVKNIVANYSFDGLRVDTTPEVKKPFWRTFNDAAGVYAVGEVFNGDPAYVAPFQNTALDGILSYPMYYTIRNVFQNGDSMTQFTQRIKDYQQFYDPTALGTFVDNHDNPRFLNGQQDVQQYKNALAYVVLSSGIPIIYYGSEQGFSGGNDPACREALWESGFNTNADLYKFITNLVTVRKDQKVWESTQVERYASDNFYAFTRGQTLVALTNKGSGGSVSETISYSPYSPGTKICDALTGTVDCITVNGEFQISLSNGQPKVYVPV